MVGRTYTQEERYDSATTLSRSGQVVCDQRLITGDIWVTMSHYQKGGHLWDAGNVVDIEQELMEKEPALNQENFSAKNRGSPGRCLQK